MELLDKLINITDLNYWEYGHKAIFLFDDGMCAHIKMSKEKFNEIEKKYYEHKLENIINESGIRNKAKRERKRNVNIDWSSFEKLYYEGYDYREISEIIDCAICTVSRKVQDDILSGILKPRFKGIFSDSRKIEKLKEMRVQGKTLKEMFEYFSCQRHTILRTLKTLRERGEIE